MRSACTCCQLLWYFPFILIQGYRSSLSVTSEADGKWFKRVQYYTHVTVIYCIMQDQCMYSDGTKADMTSGICKFQSGKRRSLMCLYVCLPCPPNQGSPLVLHQGFGRCSSSLTLARVSTSGSKWQLRKLLGYELSTRLARMSRDRQELPSDALMLDELEL